MRLLPESAIYIPVFFISSNLAYELMAHENNCICNTNLFLIIAIKKRKESFIQSANYLMPYLFIFLNNI